MALYEEVSVFPTSFVQEGLWFLQKLAPDSSAYNMPALLKLRGELNVSVLERSLNTIVARHEILRTAFAEIENEPVQIVSDEVQISFPVVDLSNAHSSEQRQRLVQQITQEEAQRPFDLGQSPLMRVGLIRMSLHDQILFVTLHHSVADGWSLSIFAHELTRLYEAFLQGYPSPLPEIAIQYADYSIWQRERLQGSVLEQQIEYWQQQLANLPHLLELPTDSLREQRPNFQGAKRGRSVAGHIRTALKSLSAEVGATLYMTLLAAFQTLLYRHTGQENILVGSPISTRSQEETEKIIGCFINQLVLSSEFSPIITFRDLLKQVRQTVLAAYAHQELPFAKVVERVQPERDSLRTPLVQVFFNMLNFPAIQLTLKGLTIEMLPSTEAGPKSDLNLYVREQEDTIFFELEYAANLFSSERIEELLNQYCLLLEQIAYSPDESVTRYTLRTKQAQSRLPDPTLEFVPAWHGTLAQHFEEQAARFPQQVAIVDAYDQASYGELQKRCNQFAHYLRAHGIAEQNVIAIYGQRDISLVWALLSIIKAGAAFTIIDPQYPPARLIEILQIARPRAWLQLQTAGQLPEALRLYLDTLPELFRCELPQWQEQSSPLWLKHYSSENPTISVDPDDLAYLAFTSGSSRKPKGVGGTHRPLSHYFHWSTTQFPFTSEDHFSLLSGLSHDPILRDIFTPLWIGASLYIPEVTDIFTPGALASWMQRSHITVTHITPALGQILTSETWQKQTALAASTASTLPTLRYIFCGGDVLSFHLINKLRALAPGATCVNYYGTTETPQAMGYLPIPATQETEHVVGYANGSVPLGRGIEGVQLLVLTATRQLAGINEVGEVYVRTPYLTRGYIDDDLLTSTSFLVNPWTNNSIDKLYKTGDLARYHENGDLSYLGRADNQVKMRGFRIELGEIEQALRQCNAVQDCTAIVTSDETGEKRILAYVVLEQEQEEPFDSMHLRHQLKEYLPSHMLPSLFIPLEELPLTPNGKIDKSALPTEDLAFLESATSSAIPQTQTEQILAAIWCDVLKISHVGIYDNFFEVGGHSLLISQVITRIREKFQIECPLTRLFEASTLAELAKIVDNELQNGIQEEPQLIALPRQSSTTETFAF